MVRQVKECSEKRSRAKSYPLPMRVEAAIAVMLMGVMDYSEIGSAVGLTPKEVKEIDLADVEACHFIDSLRERCVVMAPDPERVLDDEIEPRGAEHLILVELLSSGRPIKHCVEVDSHGSVHARTLLLSFSVSVRCVDTETSMYTECVKKAIGHLHAFLLRSLRELHSRQPNVSPVRFLIVSLLYFAIQFGKVWKSYL